MVQLNSNRLQVEIALPDEAPNNTFRFDRAGFITEVVLDGKHWFCATEPNNLSHPSTGGRGLCNEYVYDISGSVGAGESFPKFGIGELIKPDENPYCFYRKYEYQPYPIHWKQSENSIELITESLTERDYSLRHIKTITVYDNKLSMTVEIENLGSKTIAMSEYCHNFISIDGMALGPGYVIDMPFITDRGTKILEGTVKGNGKGFTFESYNPKAAMVFVEKDDINNVEKFSYRLYNSDAKAAIDVFETFRPSRILLWAADHIVSVETFHESNIAPGMRDSWVREWTFYEL